MMIYHSLTADHKPDQSAIKWRNFKPAKKHLCLNPFCNPRLPKVGEIYKPSRRCENPVCRRKIAKREAAIILEGLKHQDGIYFELGLSSPEEYRDFQDHVDRFSLRLTKLRSRCKNGSKWFHSHLVVELSPDKKPHCHLTIRASTNWQQEDLKQRIKHLWVKTKKVEVPKPPVVNLKSEVVKQVIDWLYSRYGEKAFGEKVIYAGGQEVFVRVQSEGASHFEEVSLDEWLNGIQPQQAGHDYRVRCEPVTNIDKWTKYQHKCVVACNEEWYRSRPTNSKGTGYKHFRMVRTSLGFLNDTKKEIWRRLRAYPRTLPSTQ